MADTLTERLVYHFRLIGGPSDGLTLTTEDPSIVQCPTFALPTWPLETSDVSALLRTGEYHSSTYAIANRRVQDGAGGRAVNLTYEFVAFETSPQKEQASISQRRASHGRLGEVVLKAWSQLSAWLLAPVNFPLNYRA